MKALPMSADEDSLSEQVSFLSDLQWMVSSAMYGQFRTVRGLLNRVGLLNILLKPLLVNIALKVIKLICFHQNSKRKKY